MSVIPLFDETAYEVPQEVGKRQLRTLMSKARAMIDRISGHQRILQKKTASVRVCCSIVAMHDAVRWEGDLIAQALENYKSGLIFE
jgi:hypothetical protein